MTSISRIFHNKHGSLMRDIKIESLAKIIFEWIASIFVWATLLVSFYTPK